MFALIKQKSRAVSGKPRDAALNLIDRYEGVSHDTVDMA